jgi:uncharacterized protein YcbX
VDVELRGTRIGGVMALWRYPVQSLRGEALRELEVGLDGAIGDRRYGIADPEIGELVSSAQGKRRWRGLVAMSARYDGTPRDGATPPPVVIETADGLTFRSDEADADLRLGEIVGRPARLVRNGTVKAPYGHDPIHLLTTASLKAFSAHYPMGRFAPERFRPNIVLDTGPLAGFIENDWIGRVLAIGENLRLVVKDHCKRCVMTTLAQGDLPQDPAILQVVNETNHAHAGIYADVTRVGKAKVGDAVMLLD